MTLEKHSNAAPFAVPHAYALPIEGGNAATNAGEGASNIYGVSDGGRNVYLYGSPRPIPVVPLGLYRFSTARDLSIEGLRLE